MISATQREALAVLSELCALSPEVRLGQLLAHLGFLGEDRTGRTLWDIDDQQLLEALYQHRRELSARSAESHDQASARGAEARSRKDPLLSSFQASKRPPRPDRR